MSWNCEKCGADVKTRNKDKICQKCEIGDENPAHWALGQVKASILEGPFRSWQKNSKRYTGHESLKYHISGEYRNQLVPKPGERENYVAISCSAAFEYKDETFSNGTLSFHRWTDDGSSSYAKAGPFTISSIETLVEEGLPHFHEALVDLLTFARTDQFFCAGCKKPFSQDKVEGRYFAGKYCSPCWEFFKKKNSRQCLKCRRPQYECYC